MRSRRRSTNPALASFQYTIPASGGNVWVANSYDDQTRALILPGKISDAQAWNYALTPTQVSALYKRVN